MDKLCFARIAKSEQLIKYPRDSPKDFLIRIQYDGNNPLVIVSHPISGIERRGCPSALESVGQIKSRLLKEIEREFYDPTDLRFDHGHGRRDGKTIGFIRVIHLPTGINSARELDAKTKGRPLMALVTLLLAAIVGAVAGSIAGLLIWNKLRNMARGNMARGNMARGNMARGNMARELETQS